MSRIHPVRPETADSATADLLGAVKKKLGVVPNLVGAMARSLPVAKAYVDFSGTLAGGALPARLREQLALVVGESNACEYCVAAHTALGRKAGLTVEDTLAARRASAADAKEAAAIAFARRVVDTRGKVADADLERVRAAGYGDGEVAEIVAHVALNVFTNYFNNVARTDVDFPAAPALPHTA